ncbi:MAG: hypothetical protein AAF515_05655 [Pseudomonadota bacterium]
MTGTDDRAPRIGVLGAGVAGLVAALACDFAGLGTVTVHPLAETGGGSLNPNRGIELRANATRVLRALGLLDALSGQGHYPQFAYRRAHGSGFLIAQLPIGQLAEARYGAPAWLIERDVLLAELEDIAGARGIRTAPPARIARIDSDGDCASITAADGATRSYGVLIATEPELRPLLGIEPYATDASETLRYGWGSEPDASSITHWLGELTALTVHSTGLRLAFEARGPRDHSFDAWRSPPIEGAFVSLPYPVGQPAPDWAPGRIALLGGAAHAPLPELRQDVGAAIEDAWVLARLLDQWEDESVSALREYHHYRAPRGRQLATYEARARTARRVAPGSAQLKARLAAGAMSRFLPEMALSGEDWLYGYDAVKGFA